MDQVWEKERRVRIYSRLDVINGGDGDPDVESAICTMPLEDMIDHPGGEIYTADAEDEVPERDG